MRAAIEAVEGAKSALVAVVPRSGRLGGIPLAEGLARFEAGLADAATAIDALERAFPAEPHPPGGELAPFQRALREAGDAAEALRLSDPPATYEGLIAVVAGLMEPLEAFEALS